MMRAVPLLLSLALLGAVSSLEAQQVSVTAQLVAAAPTGTSTRDLAFGPITRIDDQIVVVSVPAAQAPVSATRQAGEFRFNIGSAAGVEFNVSVPSELSAGTSEPLPITFNSAEYGGLCVSRPGAACIMSDFNPAAPTPLRVCQQTLGNGHCDPNRIFSPGTELSIYIGGMVSVPPTATPTLYTGTITVTITQVY